MSNDQLPPTLDRLADDLEAAFSRSELRQERRRVHRRIGITAALLVVAAPTAIATKSVWDPAPSRETAGPRTSGLGAILQTGTSGRETWRLTGFESTRDGFCLRLTTSESSAESGTSCRAPIPTTGSFRASYGSTAQHTYVFGRAPRDGTRVEIRFRGRRYTTSVATPDSAAMQQLHGTPQGRRTFVFVLERPFHIVHPPLVRVVG